MAKLHDMDPSFGWRYNQDGDIVLIASDGSTQVITATASAITLLKAFTSSGAASFSSTLAVTGASTFTGLVSADAGADISSRLHVRSASETLSALSGASATTTGLIPAGALVLAVSARVTTLITGATTWDAGDGTDVDAYGAALALAADTTSTLEDWTLVAAPVHAAASEVVVTANGSNFTAGAISIEAHYITATAPVA